MLEILLSLLFLSILVSSFAHAYRKKARIAQNRACAELGWRWMRAAEEIELKLRSWEIQGGPCLSAGVLPVGATEEGRTPFRELLASYPVVRPVLAEGLLELPPSASLAARQEVFLCEESGHFRGSVARIHPGGGFTTPVEIEAAEPGGRRSFAPGSLLAAVTPVEYESVPSESPPARYLYERIGQRQRIVTAGFDRFVLHAVPGPWDGDFAAEIAFGRGDCGIRREFSVRGAELAYGAGRWRISGSDLLYEPFEIRAERKK